MVLAVGGWRIEIAELKGRQETGKEAAGMKPRFIIRSPVSL
jgi:hypothetical protein